MSSFFTVGRKVTRIAASLRNANFVFNPAMNIYYYLINMGPLLVILICFALADLFKKHRQKRKDAMMHQ